MKITRKTKRTIAGMVFVTGEKKKIFASMSARDITRNLVRVNSSNIWAYGINVRRTQDKTGDVYVQFKGKYGGADDIYVYYDVPVTVYRRWLGAPSKGHFFHQYIRNNYVYAKLTGDKITRYKNGINYVPRARKSNKSAEVSK